MELEEALVDLAARAHEERGIDIVFVISDRGDGTPTAYANGHMDQLAAAKLLAKALSLILEGETK